MVQSDQVFYNLTTNYMYHHRRYDFDDDDDDHHSITIPFWVEME